MLQHLLESRLQPAKAGTPAYAAKFRTLNWSISPRTCSIEQVSLAQTAVKKNNRPAVAREPVVQWKERSTIALLHLDLLDGGADAALIDR